LTGAEGRHPWSKRFAHASDPGRAQLQLELRWDGVSSLADALRMLKIKLHEPPHRQWVRVIGGWTEFQFAERRMPTSDEINAVAPDTPVFVMHLYDPGLLTQRRACRGL